MTIGVVYAQIKNGAWDDTKEPSCLSLPGSGLTAAYMECNFGVKITVEDDLATYCSINGGYVRQSGIVGSNFPCWLWCEDHDWGGTITDENKGDWIDDPQCFLRFTQTKPAEKGDLRYNFSAASGRGTYIGQLDNFVWESETSGTGYVWIGGSAIYDSADITDPIAVISKRIAIEGLRDLLTYYPWSIKKGGSYASCNRTGGSLKKRRGSTWVERKNTESSDASKSTVFKRKSGLWVRCPKQ